ncbi:flagellar hook-length control protein FliK [Sporosarcina sp. FSL K6-1522]|uniref:flagellar hook-length control protein FliK n=1 Tax=Sporosarcina sp. FSL K6-1522 TaxID=2921554 RepID=UPI003159FAA3
MNIAAMQQMIKMPTQASAGGSKASASTFGSVFTSMTANSATADQELSTNEVSADSILSIFHATSIEQLEEAMKELGHENTDATNLLAQLGSVEEQREDLLALLEKAGLSESELTEMTFTNDIWVVLEKIDKIAPQFFEQLTTALDGKADMSKQQAVDVLTLLKTIELVAPKTDLLVRQEQQIASLQSFLVAAGAQFEEGLQVSKTAATTPIPFMDSQHAARIVVQTQSSPSLTDDGNAPKQSEVSQQVASHAIGNVAVAKGDFSITEEENRTNARNEALTREMQNIFKRANFGQTGGTNRLLIKLYPEHLGQVRIELLQVNGVMTARILASTALGKEMLDSQLNQLRNAFIQQNLQVERIDVSQTLQDTARNDREQAFNQHLKQQEQETNEGQEQNEDEEQSFQEYLIELEV